MTKQHQIELNTRLLQLDLARQFADGLITPNTFVALLGHLTAIELAERKAS